MKVFITKYALTQGILEKEAEVEPSGWNNNISYASVRDEFMGIYSFRVGTEAFLNLDDAKKNAEERRVKKIESLKKQIKKLENLKIEVK